MSLTFTAHAYGRYHDVSRHSAGINDFFSEHTWSFVILSSNVTISTPRLSDSQTSRSRTLFLWLGPAELFADLLLRLAASLPASPDDKMTTKLTTKQPILVSTMKLPCSSCCYSDIQIELEAWRLSFLLLITSSCIKSNLQSSTITVSPVRRGVNMRLGSQNRFCQVPFRSIWPIRPLSDLSPNLQDFPGPLAFQESTISSNKPLQYLPCGHAMLFSLFGI